MVLTYDNDATTIDTLVVDISGQQIIVEDKPNNLPSKKFTVTDQRYLFSLDSSTFGITDYNDYRNVPFTKKWKLKFYAQNNKEVTTTDLFGSNNWSIVESQWSGWIADNLNQQVREFSSRFK